MAATLPKINELKTLLFSLGIRAEDINDNFDLIRYWIESERLRTSGWGLVEGFELSKELDMYNSTEGYKYWHANIIVGPGIMINQLGQEIRVNGHTFPIQYPRSVPVTETITSDTNGFLKLRYPVYSRTYHRVVFYAPYQNKTLIEDNEITIIPIDNPGHKVNLARDIEYISEKEIKLVSRLANTEFTVSYDHSDDRIDGIFLRKDGKDYQYELGIPSTSPSEQVIQDYLNRDYYLIGFAYWHIGQEVDVEFFTEGRTFRRVYTDRNNILYLNGKPYQEKTVIYFEEPKPPEPNMLWYSLEDEILYIWRPDKNNKWDWQPVNDLSRSIVSAYTFTEVENPDDLQTFHLMPELFFYPGEHQLTIVIDQVVIMEDQYEELFYSKEEVERLLQDPATQEEGSLLYARLKQHACGYGFKLKCPLERPSVVEVRITHNLNTRKNNIGTDASEIEALYLLSGTKTVEDPDITIYATGCEYESGASQLEVYQNGLRLVCGIHYQEIKKSDGTDADRSGLLCNRFRMLTTLQTGDVLDFRVLRQVSSYANLQAIFDEYKRDLQSLTSHVNEAIAVFTEAVEDFNRTANDHTNHIVAAEQAITALKDGKMDKTTEITASHLTTKIREGIVNEKFEIERETVANDIFLPNIFKKDFVVIAYAATPEQSPVLLSSVRGDYALVDTDGGSYLQLDNRWSSMAGKVYITGLRLGV